MYPFVSEYRTIIEEPQVSVRRGIRQSSVRNPLRTLSWPRFVPRLVGSVLIAGLLLTAGTALARSPDSGDSEPPASPEPPSPSTLDPPTAVFVPGLDQIGTVVRLPAPWKLTKATADSIDDFAERLGTEQIPCFALFDEYGNCLVRDSHPAAGSGPRIDRALQSYATRRRELESEYVKLAKQLGQARASGDLTKEIGIVRGLPMVGENDRPIRGYDALERCLQRRSELDDLRRRQLWRIVAKERTLTAGKYRRELRRLLKNSEGLPVERVVRRRLERSEAGHALERHE